MSQEKSAGDAAKDKGGHNERNKIIDIIEIVSDTESESTPDAAQACTSQPVSKKERFLLSRSRPAGTQKTLAERTGDSPKVIIECVTISDDESSTSEGKSCTKKKVAKSQDDKNDKETASPILSKRARIVVKTEPGTSTNLRDCHRDESSRQQANIYNLGNSEPGCSGEHKPNLALLNPAMHSDLWREKREESLQYFFMSMYEKTKQLPPNCQTYIKRTIYDLINNVEFDMEFT
ncbi:hypothetical protein C0J52_05668 [Blattella germanica]|nr:hypothetical protein C0J52_05668 [Blattella germanica]